MIAFILIVVALFIFWKPVIRGSKKDIRTFEYWEEYKN